MTPPAERPQCRIRRPQFRPDCSSAAATGSSGALLADALLGRRTPALLRGRRARAVRGDAGRRGRSRPPPDSSPDRAPAPPEAPPAGAEPDQDKEGGAAPDEAPRVSSGLRPREATRPTCRSTLLGSGARERRSGARTPPSHSTPASQADDSAELTDPGDGSATPAPGAAALPARSHARRSPSRRQQRRRRPGEATPDASATVTPRRQRPRGRDRDESVPPGLTTTALDAAATARQSRPWFSAPPAA